MEYLKRLLIKVAKVFAVVFIIIIIGGVILVKTLPYEKFVEHFARQYLDSNGMQDVTLHVTEVSTERLAIVDIKAGNPAEATVDKVYIDYDLEDLKTNHRIKNIKVEGVKIFGQFNDGRLTFNKLKGLAEKFPNKESKDEPQKINISQVDLSNINIYINNIPEARIYVSKAEFSPEKWQGDFIVTLENIPLEAIAEMARKDSLEVTGLVSGKLPIVLKDHKIFVQNGILEAKSGGTVKYDPEGGAIPYASDNANINMINQVLKNFNFETLRLEMNGDINGDMITKLAVFGSNPEVYEGKNVQLNIKLDGNIIGLIRQTLETYTMPQQLIEKMVQ